MVELAARVAAESGPGSGAAAMEQAESLGAAVDMLEAAIADRVRTAESCGAPQAAGFRSVGAWLRVVLGMRAGRAAERVALARQLPRLGRWAKQLRAGEVSYGQAAAAAHAVKHLCDVDAERAETILSDLAAAGGSADEVAQAGARIHDVLHPDGRAETDRGRGFARRWLRRTDGLDGIAYLDGVADPELNALLRARLDPLAAPAGADDDRTAAHRYADALYTLLSDGGSHHAMTVIVDLETLTGDPPAEGGPVEGGPVEGGPVEGGPVEGGPVEGGPVEGGPVEGGPVEGEGPEGDGPAGGPSSGGATAADRQRPAGGETLAGGELPRAAARRRGAPFGQWPGPGAWLGDGTPIPAADARRIAVNAGISRLIVGPGSQPLDVGRTTPLVTPAIRRALEHRDRRCVVDGCDIPAHLCEADHITGWALGGTTALHNLALCCGFHNKYKNRHPERVQITRHPDGRVTYRILRIGKPPPRPG